MTEINDFIKRAATRSGFKREKYSDNTANTATVSKITIFLFFGDMQSEFVLSTMLMHELKKQSRYLIVCSYPGHSGLYPYADEYWTLEDEDSIESLKLNANGFSNESSVFNACERILLRYFENVMTFDNSKLLEYYNNGFVSKQEIVYKLPPIPSIQMDISRLIAKNDGKKIFIKPLKKIRVWSSGRQKLGHASLKFWESLTERLIKDKYVPVIWQDDSTHEMSSKFHDKCAYVFEHDVLTILGAMRACDCTLDIFSGLSKYCYLSRSPFISFDDRQRYNASKDYEIEDVCGGNMSYKNVFSFSSILSGDHWDNILDHISNKLGEFLPILNRDEWPTTLESETSLAFNKIKSRENKRLGVRFVKPS